MVLDLMHSKTEEDGIKCFFSENSDDEKHKSCRAL